MSHLGRVQIAAFRSQVRDLALESGAALLSGISQARQLRQLSAQTIDGGSAPFQINQRCAQAVESFLREREREREFFILQGKQQQTALLYYAKVAFF